MKTRTPLTVITGPLGSGKTTLLRYLLAETSEKIAILMNEFGEIAIDSKIIQGKNIQMAELGGGCVCCSLAGEFEAAVNEIIDTVDPQRIILETTGVAEPDALVFDIQEELTNVRLDGVITILDGQDLVRYPHLGHTTRMQIEDADLILLNKVDLVSQADLAVVDEKLHQVNELAPVIHTQRGQIDTNLLFGIGKARISKPPHHAHQPEFEAFSYYSQARFNRHKFEEFAENLGVDVVRAKGFIRFDEGSYLFNFVTGRCELEPFEQAETELVFIGKRLRDRQAEIVAQLEFCKKES